MLNNKTLEIFENITKANGISGRESNISNTLKAYYKKYSNEVVYDNLGSIYAVKKSKSPNAKHVMINSHMDEAGFMVKELKSNGLIKLLPIGSIDVLSTIGQKFDLICKESNKTYTGVIVKGQNKTSKDIKIDDIYLEIGALNKEDLEGAGVRLGDQVVFNSSVTTMLNNKKIMAKALNGRFGCIAGVELLQELADVELDFDLYVGCTVQEEVGLRGAQTATNLVQPDLAVTLDCQPCSKDKEDINGVLGKGILLTHYDKSMMPNRTLLNYLLDICKDNNIDYQHYFSTTDSDSGWIHKLRVGCPTLNLNICADNINTANTIISTDDYTSIKLALKKMVLSLNDELIEGFKVENR